MPDNQHRAFVISAYRLTCHRVDKCQSSRGNKANLASGLDRLLEPANRSVCRYQHHRADLIGALGGCLLHEWRDVAIWRVQSDVARNSQVISPWRFKCVLLGCYELATQRVMRCCGCIKLEAELSIQACEEGGRSSPEVALFLWRVAACVICHDAISFRDRFRHETSSWVSLLPWINALTLWAGISIFSAMTACDRPSS